MHGANFNLDTIQSFIKLFIHPSSKITNRSFLNILNMFSIFSSVNRSQSCRYLFSSVKLQNSLVNKQPLPELLLEQQKKPGGFEF